MNTDLLRGEAHVLDQMKRNGWVLQVSTDTEATNLYDHSEEKYYPVALNDFLGLRSKGMISKCVANSGADTYGLTGKGMEWRPKPLLSETE